MQGVEAVDRILDGAAERTYYGDMSGVTLLPPSRVDARGDFAPASMCGGQDRHRSAIAPLSVRGVEQAVVGASVVNVIVLPEIDHAPDRCRRESSCSTRSGMSVRDVLDDFVTPLAVSA